MQSNANTQIYIYIAMIIMTQCKCIGVIGRYQVLHSPHPINNKQRSERKFLKMAFFLDSSCSDERPPPLMIADCLLVLVVQETRFFVVSRSVLNSCCCTHKNNTGNTGLSFGLDWPPTHVTCTFRNHIIPCKTPMHRWNRIFIRV